MAVNKIILAAISFLWVVMFSNQILAAEQMHVLVKVETYDELVHAIRAARNASREKIEQAVKEEKVREAWEIGTLIYEHILFHSVAR